MSGSTGHEKATESPDLADSGVQLVLDAAKLFKAAAGPQGGGGRPQASACPSCPPACSIPAAGVKRTAASAFTPYQPEGAQGAQLQGIPHLPPATPPNKQHSAASGRGSCTASNARGSIGGASSGAAGLATSRDAASLNLLQVASMYAHALETSAPLLALTAAPAAAPGGSCQGLGGSNLEARVQLPTSTYTAAAAAPLTYKLLPELARTVEWVASRGPYLPKQELLFFAALVETQRHQMRLQQLKAAYEYEQSVAATSAWH